MVQFTKPAAEVFAPTTAGGAARGASMGDAQPWGIEVEKAINSLEFIVNLAYASGQVYQLKSQMTANLMPAAFTPALVVNDPTPGNNGLWMKVGGPGTGTWTRLLDFVPGTQFVVATDIGAGTPNAIVISSTSLTVGATGHQIIDVSIFEENTGSPVTITFPGLPAKTVKTSSGNNVVAGGLKAGRALGRIEGSNFRLISDQASAAIIAQAEAILAQIQAIVAGFEEHTTVDTTVTAGTMDTITLSNPAVVKDQIVLHLDGIYQHRNTFNVAGGVITPTTAWPGSGVELNVEVFYPPAVGIPVIANAIERVNVNTKFSRGMPITPFEFNANPDGVTDNTAAMVAWRDACEEDGLLPSLPRGIYSCAQNLDFSFGARIVGAGEGLTRVRITDPAGGFKCQPDINSDPYGCFRIENLDIEATVIVAKAINVILPDSGAFTNNYRVGFPNVDIYGIDGGYFQVGLYQKNIAYNQSSRIRYWGSDENPTADSGYYAGIGCDLDTQVTADNPMLGLSLENIFSGLSVHFANTGVRVRNFTEGVHLLNCNIAFVRRGVDAVAPDGTRQPLVSVIGGHFNCSEYCVKLDGFNQSQILGAHISRPGGEFTHGWTGVHLINSLNTDIKGGKIMAEAVATPSVGDMVGIRLNGDSWYSRIDTAFIGAISGDYKPMTKAIQIDAGVNGTKISPSCTYSGTITTNIDDDSGNDTNVIATGLTIKEGVTTKGPTGGVTELNFADADFNLNVTGAAVAVGSA